MATRRGSRPMRPRSPKRVRVWATTNQITSGLATNATANLDLLANSFSAAGLSHLGVTVVRTLLQISPQTVPAAGEICTVGLMVGRATDIVDPATAGLTTTSQLDLNWAWWHAYSATP